MTHNSFLSESKRQRERARNFMGYHIPTHTDTHTHNEQQGKNREIRFIHSLLWLLKAFAGVYAIGLIKHCVVCSNNKCLMTALCIIQQQNVSTATILYLYRLHACCFNVYIECDENK